MMGMIGRQGAVQPQRIGRVGSVLMMVVVLALLPPAGPRAQQVIVQGQSIAAAANAVQAMGGVVLKQLPIIAGVSALLSPRAAAVLAQRGLLVTPDHGVMAMGGKPKGSGGETVTAGLELYPRVAVGGHLLSNAVTGSGITVAYVDSGFPAMASPGDWPIRIDSRTLKAENSGRFAVYRDLLYSGNQLTNSSDPYGHGTHVMMTVADNLKTKPSETADDVTVGVAPQSNIVMVRALDDQGHGNYSTIIEAIDWIVANRTTYNIRVLNLSLDGDVAAPYWYDPLGRAVMQAWQAGIVVVAAAGNQGPDPMTIGVPGNVPYVITIGALKSGRYTTSGADELAVYSSVGPTESKFVKPDVLVPASRTLAVLPRQSLLAQNGAANLVNNDKNPDLKIGALQGTAFGYYQLSGTSMAAAEVSGIVALMLQQQPSLTNNQVKYRLTATAQVAGTSTTAQYSIWQQGAGRVDTVAAVTGTTTAAANAGMDIAQDLLIEGGTHYLGLTEFDSATNTFSMPDQEADATGYNAWAGGYNAWAGGYNAWAGGYNAWAGGFNAWAGGFNAWAGGFNAWAGGYNAWAGGYNAWAGGFNAWAGTVGDPSLR